MEPETQTTGPARARIAWLLRDELPHVLHMSRAAVFLPGPSGRPRLVASVGGEPSDPLGAGPSRLRAALLAGGPEPVARVVSFPADEREAVGEALVVPFARGGGLVVYRSDGHWTTAEAGYVAAIARFVGRALAGSAAFA